MSVFNRSTVINSSLEIPEAVILTEVFCWIWNFLLRKSCSGCDCGPGQLAGLGQGEADGALAGGGAGFCWPGIVSAPSFTEVGLLLLTGKMETLCSQLRLVRSSSLVSWSACSAGSWASQLACSLLARWWVGRLIVDRMWRQSGVLSEWRSLLVTGSPLCSEPW